MSMKTKRTSNPAELLRQAERLEARETAIRRERLELAKKLIQAGHALGGAELEAEGARPRKRRSAPRKRVPRSPETHAAVHIGPTPKDATWTETIRRILVFADRPLTYKELRDEILKTHLAAKLQKTDRSFYGAVGKLEAKKRAVRHNGRVFSPKAYEQFQRDVAAGIVRDVPPPHGGMHDSPAKIALLTFLASRPEGARTGEIISALSKMPELNLTNKTSKTVVYNLIARLVKRGNLTKQRDCYRLPTKNEAPDAEASGAPIHQGGGSGSPSSTGNASVRTRAAAPGAIPAQPGE